jgi:glycosyltransferase involved in cell wall biosynthesis
MRFSVIIPTYKRTAFLGKAIESVLNQTFTDYELIIVNDDPAEKNEINNIHHKYPQIKIYHHSESKGGNAARNLGIQNSTGELIAFLDDDDVWLPQKLEDHAAAHQADSQAGLIYSNCLYVHNNPFIQDQATSSPLPENILKAMGEAKFCPTTSSIVSIKREVIKDCGLFDEKMTSFQDWDYWFRIAHHFRFVHIPKTLVYFRQHLGDRISQNECKRLEGIRQICTKWGKEIDVEKFTKSMRRILYYQLSLNALMSGNKSAFMRKSLYLLHTKNISPRSISSFLNLWILLIIKDRKRRLQFKLVANIAVSFVLFHYA